MEGEKILLEEMLEIKPNLLSEIPTLPVTLIFHDKQTEQDIQPINGIHKYGPYDLESSDETLRRNFKGIDIFVFCPEDEDPVREALSILIEFLSSGYVKKRNMVDVNFNGIKEEFKIHARIPKATEIVEYKVGRLQEEIKEHVNEFESTLQAGNKPLVIVGGSTHRTSIQRREQYIEAKRVFTSKEIPCQYASYYEYEDGGVGLLYQILKDSQNHNIALGHAIWNFCLNVYGKVGGLAWIVRQKLSPKTSKIVDLSIGLRFSMSKEHKGYKIGHATILDRFGRLVGSLTLPPFYVKGMKIPKELMKKFIQDILKKALKDPRIRKIYESTRKEILNIAIHRPNFFNIEEIFGIKEALSKIKVDEGFKQINYGLISIIKEPTFISFYKGTEFESITRGTAFRLNEKSAALYTAGSFTPTDKRPMIYPIIVSCQNLKDENSIFETIEEICNHVLNLSALHWQTVIPASVRLPATLEFAENIAKLASYGVQLPTDSWLDRTLWFI